MLFIIFNKYANSDPSWCDEIVNVMRPNVLGNPYVVPPSGLISQESSIISFKQWLITRFQDSESPQAKEIDRLRKLHRQGKNIALICCCAPKACHADVIKEICSL